MRTRTELRQILQTAIDIVKEHGPDAYMGPASQYLHSVEVTEEETHWLAPRLVGWVNGARWAYRQAQNDALDLDARGN